MPKTTQAQKDLDQVKSVLHSLRTAWEVQMKLSPATKSVDATIGRYSIYQARERYNEMRKTLQVEVDGTLGEDI